MAKCRVQPEVIEDIDMESKCDVAQSREPICRQFSRDSVGFPTENWHPTRSKMREPPTLYRPYFLVRSFAKISHSITDFCVCPRRRLLKRIIKYESGVLKMCFLGCEILVPDF